MPLWNWSRQSTRRFRLRIGLTLLAVGVATPQVRAQGQDFDVYKIRISGFWFHSDPSGNLQSSGQYGLGLVDINRDLGFSSFDTFAGKVDWKFTRKNHLYFATSPFRRSHQTVLNRTIVFQGQTFDVGLVTNSDLRADLYALGYQYDIMRRRRGHLGIAGQVNLFDTKTKISAAAQASGGGGVQQAVRSASGSLWPQFRSPGPNSACT